MGEERKYECDDCGSKKNKYTITIMDMEFIPVTCPNIRARNSFKCGWREVSK